MGRMILVTTLDFYQALRLHLRRPGVTVAIVTTLALGIGANTAIFNIVNGILLRPLAYPESERLVRIDQTLDILKSSPNPRLQAIWNKLPTSYLNAEDWRKESRHLSGIGLYRTWTTTFTGGDEPERLQGARVDDQLFSVLGVPPTEGRVFNPDDLSNQANVVVLSHRFWQQAFGGDPDILEKKVPLGSETYDVIGVMPAGFRIAGRPDDQLWVPIHLNTDALAVRDRSIYTAMARLRPDATFQAAREDLEEITARLAKTYPDSNDGIGVHMVPLLDTLVEESRPLLYLLTATVAAVLIVACVNVVHLLLAQAAARRSDLAMRMVLGANRRTLMRQLLAETLPLALVGGLLGLGIAVLVQDALIAWIPTDLPRVESIGLDLRVLFFTFGISVACAGLCGLLPAWLASGKSLANEIKSGGVRAGRSNASRRLHAAFVIAEIALTLMLTISAALLAKSFFRLSAVDPGFATAGRLVQKIQLPAFSYPEEHHHADFSRRLLETLENLPGTENAALTTKLPLAGRGLVWGFRIPGRDTEEEDWTQGRTAYVKYVTPTYFATLKIPIIHGRGFREADNDQKVLVVNETLASEHWPQSDAVGQSIITSTRENYTIIGVVANVRHSGLEAEPGPLMYQPWGQGNAEFSAVLSVRGGDPLAVAPVVRQAIRDLDATLPIPQAQTLAGLTVESLKISRSRTTLVALLAGLGILLALLGVYAVMSFTVQWRQREIGVRMALGADTANVYALVLRRVIILTSLGIVFGTPAAFFSSRLLQGLLFGIEPTDPATFLVAVALIAFVCLLAGYLPARRAGHLDPVKILRAE